MKIACLGWGSLIWDPRELPIQKHWFNNGPFLPIEFARQSNNGRLTLVIIPESISTVQSLWTLFSVPTTDQAFEALRRRENTSSGNIAMWSKANPKNNNQRDISKWAENANVEAVIWTVLPPKFNGIDGNIPTIDEAIIYLRQLPLEKKNKAEEYVRMAPRQVKTPYRRHFETEFGWTPQGNI